MGGREFDGQAESGLHTVQLRAEKLRRTQRGGDGAGLDCEYGFQKV